MLGTQVKVQGGPLSRLLCWGIKLRWGHCPVYYVMESSQGERWGHCPVYHVRESSQGGATVPFTMLGN